MGESGHLLFVWKTTGYELREAEGDPPVLGATVEVDDNASYVVAKVGPSPRPGDSRPCAFLQTAP